MDNSQEKGVHLILNVLRDQYSISGMGAEPIVKALLRCLEALKQQQEVTPGQLHQAHKIVKRERVATVKGKKPLEPSALPNKATLVSTIAWMKGAAGKVSEETQHDIMEAAAFISDYYETAELS